MTTTNHLHPLTGWGLLSFARGDDGLETCRAAGTIRAVISTGAALGDCALVDFSNPINGAYTFSQLIPLADLTGSGQLTFKLFPNMDHRDRFEGHQQTANQYSQAARIVK